jgi:hypothetical protein
MAFFGDSIAYLEVLKMNVCPAIADSTVQLAKYIEPITASVLGDISNNLLRGGPTEQHRAGLKPPQRNVMKNSSRSRCEPHAKQAPFDSRSKLFSPKPQCSKSCRQSVLSHGIHCSQEFCTVMMKKLNKGIGCYVEYILDECPNSSTECTVMLEKMHSIAKYSSSSHILGVVLFTRVISCDPEYFVKAGRENWKFVVFVCIMIAQKQNDDDALCTKEFSKIWSMLPGFDGQSTEFSLGVSRMEMCILMTIDWQVAVESSIYESFVCELAYLGSQG